MLVFESGRAYRLVKMMSLQPTASGQLMLMQKLSRNEDDDIDTDEDCVFTHSSDDGFHFLAGDGREFVVDSSIVRLCFVSTAHLQSAERAALLAAQKELDTAIQELIELIDMSDHLDDDVVEKNGT